MTIASRDKDKSAFSGFVAVQEASVPDKKYFKIGEVAHLVGVEPHVLRYWQTQFPQVRPHKSRSGHRMFRRRDVHTLLAIKELLHVQRFTIAGARQALRSMARGEHVSIPPIPVAEAAPVQAPAAKKAVSAAPVRGQDIARHEPHVQVEIMGLDDDALRNQSEAQLAQANGERAVEVEAHAADDMVDDGDGPAEVIAPVAKMSGAPTGSAAVRPVEGGQRTATSAEASSRPVRGQGQLGFGFQRSDRELLLKARADLKELLLLVEQPAAKSMFA